MRRFRFSALLAAAAMIGAAHAAPSFGSASHRLSSGGNGAEANGGGSSSLSFLDAMLSLLGVADAAKAATKVEDDMMSQPSKTKECEETEKAERAKAEASKPKSSQTTAKPKSRGGEPIYLAF